MTDLFEKPQVQMVISDAPVEKPKRKKKEFTPEQKAKFVERMKKAREAKLLKKAQELNEKSKSNSSPSTESTSEVVKESVNTRKPRKKKETVVSTPPQSHQYDYSYINNLNTSINQLNHNLMNLASRSQPQPQPKPKLPEDKPKEVKEEPPKIESKAEEPRVKMAEIPQKATIQNNPNQKRKIWNATRRAYVYV